MGPKKQKKNSRGSENERTRSGKKQAKKHGKKPEKKQEKKQEKKARGIALAEPAAVDVIPTITSVDVGVHELQLRLEGLQAQFVGVVSALDESTERLQAAVALIADLPTSGAATDSGRELRQRLERMLVAQQRTNELLDLALGVAVATDISRPSV
jgi:hypothetical protein